LEKQKADTLKNKLRATFIGEEEFDSQDHVLEADAQVRPGASQISRIRMG